MDSEKDTCSSCRHKMKPQTVNGLPRCSLKYQFENEIALTDSCESYEEGTFVFKVGS
jgi:hypothetical protein